LLIGSFESDEYLFLIASILYKTSPLIAFQLSSKTPFLKPVDTPRKLFFLISNSSGLLILSNSLLSQTHPNYTRLKNRSKELEELGALAFDRKIPE
jgi:hypothetical protein